MSEQSLPQDVLNLCKSFAGCLEVLDEAQLRQAEGILELSVKFLEAARKAGLSHKGNRKAEADETLQPILTALAAASKERQETSGAAAEAALRAFLKEQPEGRKASGETLTGALVQALGTAISNAVVTQQQMSTILAAATAQGVELLYGTERSS